MIFDKLFKNQPENFLTVNLFSKSAVFSNFQIEKTQGLQVLDFIYYPFQKDEGLLSAIRKYLAKIGAKSGLNVVFGLPSFWIEAEKVKPEYEGRLLEITRELKLIPMAFVSTTAAVGFYEFRQDPDLADFYILQVFDQKILSEKFENGEIVKTGLNEFADFESVNFASIFGSDIPKTIFVFSENNQFDKLFEKIRHFFETDDKPAPNILKLAAEDFAKSLATATAFDLGQLPQVSKEVLGEEKLETKEVAQEKPEFGEFGFVEGEDIGQISPTSDKTAKSQSKFATLLAFILTVLPNFPLKNFVQNLGRKRLIAFGIIPTVVIVGAILAFWFVPSAVVELDVESSPYSQDFNVRAVPAISEIDSQNLQIPSKVFTTTKDGNKKIVTSGKKKIGEKAKGTITVFNKTQSPKTFSSGLVLLGPSNQKFVLTESVTVASRSATLEGIIFGKNKAGVEATEIGEAGNLSASTNLNFADFDSSQYSAHVEEGFSGGIAKEVSIVSQDDRQRLESELTRELTESAKKELIEKAADKIIEDKAIISKAEKLEFDKAVGEEANILQLTAKINFSATIFALSDLETLISDNLKDGLPQDFASWQNQKLQPEILKVENDGTLRLKVKFEADLIPAVNNDEILSNISGKSIDEAKNYLLDLDNVENVKIEVRPKLPGFLGTLPRSKAKIKLEVKSQIS